MIHVEERMEFQTLKAQLAMTLWHVSAMTISNGTLLKFLAFLVIFQEEHKFGILQIKYAE
jgi:hypothetical protein